MGQPRFEWMLDPGGKGDELVPLCGVVNSRAVHSNVDKDTESEKGGPCQMPNFGTYIDQGGVGINKRHLGSNFFFQQ